MPEPVPRSPRGLPIDPVFLLGTLGAGVAFVGIALASVPGWTNGSKQAVVAGTLLLGAAALTGLIRPSEPRPPRREPETWVCYACMRPYRPGAHFCPRCAAPVSVLATTAPYERIYAWMWMFGRAAHHGWRALHLVSLFLYSAPRVLLVGLLIAAHFTDAYRPSWSVLGEIAAMLDSVLTLVLVYYATRRVLAGGRRPPWLSVYTPYGTPPWWSFDATWPVEAELDDAADAFD